MENEAILFIFRGLERLAIVTIAGILIYLGYKLFILLPNKTNSEGKIELPGGISIYLSRIGPGAFLALFGAIILVYSVKTQLNTNLDNGKNDSIPEVIYMANTEKLASIIQWEEIYLEIDIESLNKLNNTIENMIESGEEKPIDFQLAAKLSPSITRIKGMMMLRHWKKEWGDSIIFYNWIKEGVSDKAPPEIEKAVEFFNRN